MKACVLDGPCKTRIVDMPVPEINENEVLIRVGICGVCATDIVSWKKGYAATGPVIGHEPVGTVEKVGSYVRGFSVGDRVTGLALGSYAEFVKADCSALVKVPDNLEDIEAMGEPLACLISGADRTAVQLGDTAAIIGMGFMGLGFLQLMRMKGAGQIICISRRQQSLDNALRFGADIVFAPDQVEEKYKATSGWDLSNKGADVVIEASGTQQGLDLAGAMTAPHGILSILGYHQDGTRQVDMELWNRKAISVINAHERRSDVRRDCMIRGFSLISSGRLNMKGLITHEFKPEELDKAFECILEKPKGFIKSVVRF